jgi:Xaa-Pro aminopeptidase
LYDFHGINPGRRASSASTDGHATLLRAATALRHPGGDCASHRAASFDGFPGEVRPYAAWSELHENLRALVSGKTVAMEVSPGDAVPYVDRVPHGVIELIESFGAHVVSSGTLVTRFAARWSASELAGHRRAAEALAEIAADTLRWAGARRRGAGSARDRDAGARHGRVPPSLARHRSPADRRFPG